MSNLDWVQWWEVVCLTGWGLIMVFSDKSGAETILTAMLALPVVGRIFRWW